jgi:hypothetical protein
LATAAIRREPRICEVSFLTRIEAKSAQIRLYDMVQGLQSGATIKATPGCAGHVAQETISQAYLVGTMLKVLLAGTMFKVPLAGTFLVCTTLSDLPGWACWLRLLRGTVRLGTYASPDFRSFEI